MYQYKYNVANPDGGRTMVGFNFSPETGRMSMLHNELTMLVAAGSYQEIPDPSHFGRTLNKIIEDAENNDGDNPQFISIEDFGKREMRTLLVPVDSPWCSSGEQVNETTHVVRGALGMTLKAAITEAANMSGRFAINTEVPIIRSKNLAFLWDIFCYFQSNKEGISQELDREPEEHTQLIELFGDAFERPTPWDIGFWVLPVDIFNDIDNIVMRVPYDVMTDLYESNYTGDSSNYDGERLNNTERAIDVTDEFRKMLEKRSNREN